MNNELKIKPLLEYRLNYDNDTHTTFTADSYEFDEASHALHFYRTGNLIRVVLDRPREIIATPVAE